jgi:hypothetical protein
MSSGAIAKLKWKNLKDSYRDKFKKLPPPKSGVQSHTTED